ncbi:hypothetical protein KBB25_03115 [Candidatus Gracilibacteria bacterium]|jgi:hypothetical protein|nr:hypothetical protein [Candidatus Gracilibacteria bacterium]
MLDPTNAEKLDEIYRILKKQEARQRTSFWYHIFKLFFLIGLGFFLFTNSSLILGKLTDILIPLVTENMKTVMKDQKNGLLDQMKDMLPPDIQLPSSEQ